MKLSMGLLRISIVSGHIWMKFAEVVGNLQHKILPPEIVLKIEPVDETLQKAS